MIDNQAAIALINNCQLSRRAKHIDIRFHFIRDLVTRKQIEPVYCPSKENLADIFTKSIPKPQFEQLKIGIGMTDCLLPGNGGVLKYNSSHQ